MLSEVCLLLLLMSYFYCILYMKLFQLKTSAKYLLLIFSDYAIIFKIQKCRTKNYSRDNSQSQCTLCISQATSDKHMHCL